MRKRRKRKRRHGIEFRADRVKWGYRLYFRGRKFKKFAWNTQEEARAARSELLEKLRAGAKFPEIPPTALVKVVNDYLADSADPDRERSAWRPDGLRLNFKAVILPHLGSATPIAAITKDNIETMIKARRRKVKPKTVCHDVTNVRAVQLGDLKKTPDHQSRGRDRYGFNRQHESEKAAAQFKAGRRSRMLDQEPG